MLQQSKRKSQDGLHETYEGRVGQTTSRTRSLQPETAWQQATFVASKSMILETNIADITEETSSPPTEQLLPPQNQHEKDSNPTFTRDKHQNNNNNSGSHFEFNVDQSLFNDLQDRFHKFYNVH